jgi:hypothetical protein
LEDVDNKLVVVFSRDHLSGSIADRFSDLAIQQTESLIGASRRIFDQTRCVDEDLRKPHSADGKVLHRPLSLRAIVGVLRHPYFTHRIPLDTVLVCGHVLSLGGYFVQDAASQATRVN